MISGFSTDEVGNFNMTISYGGLSQTVAYTVSHKPIPLTQSEAEGILNETARNMSTFSEVKETITYKLFTFTITSYTITTPTKQYSFNDEENQSWIVNEDGSWKFYEISCLKAQNLLKHIYLDLIM